ncbi:hypothetical protein C8R48DRAFT_673952 [Suillus tomentosus]|nr:hypothetical protein C8R48DRAFT_673952 [Suillus tomentosus]
MCGGSFQHTLSDNDSLSVMLKNLAGDGSVKPMNNEGKCVAGSTDSEDKKITTKKRSTNLETSSQIVVDDALTEHSSSSQMTRSKAMASKKVSSQIDSQDSLSVSSLKSRSISISSKMALSHIDADAGDNASTHKKPSMSSSKRLNKADYCGFEEEPEGQKANAQDKVEQGLGKQKVAASPVVESEDEFDEELVVTPSVEPEAVEDNEVDSKRSAEEEHEYDDILFPSMQDGWKEIKCLIMTEDKTNDGSTTPEASLVDAANAKPKEDVATSNTIPEEYYEIEVVPQDDTTVIMI